MKDQRKESSSPDLVDVGNCNLNAVLGTFQIGVEPNGQNLKQVTKGCFHFWKDLPAWCEDFIIMTILSNFALYICANRFEYLKTLYNLVRQR